MTACTRPAGRSICGRFTAKAWDGAVVQRVGPAEFECGFGPATWDNVAGLVQPFAVGAVGFLWLVGTPGEGDLLFSADGRW